MMVTDGGTESWYSSTVYVTLQGGRPMIMNRIITVPCLSEESTM